MVIFIDHVMYTDYCDKLTNKKDSLRYIYVYAEDSQEHWCTPFIFETDCNCIDTMESISKLPAGAGRMSTPFSEFKKLMEAHRYEVNLIRRELNTTKVYKYGWDVTDYNLPVVHGATGNY